MTKSFSLSLPSKITEGQARVIVARALAYAVATIDALPEQSWPLIPTRNEMVALFAANFGAAERDLLVREVQKATGRAPDMAERKIEE